MPENDRYRIHVEVTAEKGLKEIALYDGAELVRRLLWDGEASCVADIEGYQDRNRNFLAKVTDTAGGSCLTAPGWTNVQEIMLVRCTDNLNTYTSGKFKAVNYHALRGLESYIDQQAGQFNYFPLLDVPETERLAVEQRIIANSRFGYIKDDVVEYHYPPTASANWNRTDTPELALPQTAIKGKTRITLFAPRPNGTSVYLVEGDYTTLRDMDLPRAGIPVFQANWVKDAATIYVSRSGGKGFACNLLQRQPYFDTALEGVEYVVQFPTLGGSRAFVPLSEGLTCAGILSDERHHLGGSIAIPTKKIANGTPVRFRYLAAWDTVGGRPDISFIEDVYSRLGLRGQTAYAVRPGRGEVLDTKFILRLKAEGYAFSGTITQASLPLDLPVTIEGLNPRWPAGILYKGENDLMVPVWKINRVGDRNAVMQKTRGENQLRRFAIVEGIGMLQVDTEIGDKRVYIGNLLVCDQPEVFLGLDDARPGKQVVSVNNPTDQALTVTVKPGPGFDLMPALSRTLQLKAGEMVTFKVQ